MLLRRVWAWRRWRGPCWGRFDRTRDDADMRLSPLLKLMVGMMTPIEPVIYGG